MQSGVAWPFRLPATSDPMYNVAILNQPRGSSRGRRRPVFLRSPFPSCNGGSSATRTYVELGVQEDSHWERCPFPAWIWPCPAQPVLAVTLLLPASRPRKNKGAWPSPSHSSGSSQSSPSRASLSPVPVPVPVPVAVPIVVTISIWSVLQKLSIDLSYRGVACPVPASLKPGFCPPKIPPSSPPSARLKSSPLLRALRSYSRGKHQRLYSYTTTRRAQKRVGDARRILPNPTLNYWRADQRHCQKRLLDSGTSPTVHKER